MNENNRHYIYPETWTVEKPKPTPKLFEYLEQWTENPSSEEIPEVLNDVYKTLSAEHRNIITACNELQLKNLIDSNDKLFLAILLAYSEVAEYKIDSIKDALLSYRLETTEKEILLAGIQCPPATKKHLETLIDKVQSIKQ